tara:strand:+ start:240 stop:833 length:594 start_codon:yes stop_codon:yes gene_type:complete
MKQEKRFIKIKDHIGIFDNFVDSKTCKRLITIFEKDKNKSAYTRKKIEGAHSKIKKDLAITFNTYNNWTRELEEVCKSLREILEIYEDKTSFCDFTGIRELEFTSIKVQKTIPGEGYHVWHCEKNYQTNDCRRALVWTLYLNDIEEGGETEFLLQNQRAQAKEGRICVFPAGFPFVHRGNPPLKKDKYIATSWWLSR